MKPLHQLLSKLDARSAKAYKNILSSFIIKGLSIVINLALVPMTINYLNPTKYGVWLTISSIMGWINFFDIGLGHGLRNKLAEALAKDEYEKAKGYVSTAYVSIAILCASLFLLFMVVNQFLNWNHLLNVPPDINEDLHVICFILFSMFALQFTLQLIHSVFLGTQQPAKVSMVNMISNIIVLGSISILIKHNKESLKDIAFVFSAIPVLVLIVTSLYFYKFKLKKIAPSFSAFNSAYLKDVLNLGVKFFVIQITVLIFFQTSNLLICQFLGPAMVTPYNIAFRYFGVITMVFSIITAPYWSAYTEAYVKGDTDWMKKTMRMLFKLWCGLAVLGIVMLFCSDFAYHHWIGDKVKVDFKISFFMLLYTLGISFGNIYIMVLNGIGKIKLQMIMNVIFMVLFVPLAYFLTMTLKMGISGIIISSIVCSSYGILIAPFEVRKYV